jgi:hypothetical protein
MLSSNRRTMKVDKATATMVAQMIVMLPVTCATMRDVGQRRAGDPAEHRHHPDHHVRRGRTPDRRRHRRQQPPHGEARERPDHHAGAEHPSGPARPDRQGRGPDPGERQQEDDDQRRVRELAPQSLLDPAVYPVLSTSGRPRAIRRTHSPPTARRSLRLNLSQ